MTPPTTTGTKTSIPQAKVMPGELGSMLVMHIQKVKNPVTRRSRTEQPAAGRDSKPIAIKAMIPVITKKP
jgi:hypothetical protein